MQKKDEIFVAVIGDIVSSKKIQNRSHVQEKFKIILNNINETYKDDIASNFMITLGDEFQGLLNEGKNAIKIVSDIEIKMMPQKLRFGIGIGGITTTINPDYPLGADGPAYYNARNMIEELKKKENQYKENFSNIMISIDPKVTKHPNDFMLLNSLLSLCSLVKSQWTLRQIEIINSYLNNDENQYKTADKLEVVQSTVNRSLIKSNFYSYKKAIESISLYLSEEVF